MSTIGFGEWPSPITSSHLVEHSVGLSDLDVVDGALVWAELRPSEHGRQVVVRCQIGEAPVDLIPEPFSARSSVHEYGGAPFVVVGDRCWFVNFADQRIWLISGNQSPIPITPDDEPTRSVRYADLVIDDAQSTLYAVRERHGVDGIAGAAGVVNDLVAMATDGSQITTIASGHDFYAAPRLSPDGRRLVFIAWDHPNMPWDESALFSIDLADTGPQDTDRDGTERSSSGVSAPTQPVRIAGSPAEAVSQPRFSHDGTLHYLSDRSGFTSLYREDGTAVVEIGADLAEPDWVFGQASYAFFGDGAVVVAVSTALGSTLTRSIALAPIG